jgi:hypothetical protein
MGWQVLARQEAEGSRCGLRAGLLQGYCEQGYYLSYASALHLGLAKWFLFSVALAGFAVMSLLTCLMFDLSTSLSYRSLTETVWNIS